MLGKRYFRFSAERLGTSFLSSVGASCILSVSLALKGGTSCQGVVGAALILSLTVTVVVTLGLTNKD